MIQGSVFGVLSAISGFYGLRDANHLLKINGLKTIKTVDVSDDYLKLICSNKQILEDIELFTDIDVKQPIFDDEIFQAITKSKRLKVCKDCIAEGVLHQPQWQRIDTLYCDQHKQHLVNVCDHLYAQGTWPKSMTCSDCFTPPHANAENQQAPSVHVYLSGLSSKERASQVMLLTAIATHLLRPFDFIRSEIAWSTYDAGSVALLLEDAYQVAGQANALELWKKCRQQHRAGIAPLGTHVVQFEDERLSFLLSSCNWKTTLSEHEFLDILKKYHHFVSDSATVSKKLYFNDTNKLTGNALSNRIDHKQLYKFLDIYEFERIPVGKFFDKSSFDHRSYFDKGFYDVQSVCSILSKHLLKHQCVEDKQYVSLYDAPFSLLDLLYVNHRDINYHLLFGQLEWRYLQQAQGAPVNRVFLSVDSILKLSAQKIKDTGHVALQDAIKLFGLSKQQIQSLIKEDFLAVAPHQQGSSFKLSSHSVRRFFKENILLNREALLDGVCVDMKLNELRHHFNIKPTVVQSEEHEPIYIVSQYEGLEDSIVATISSRLNALPFRGFQQLHSRERISKVAA